MLIDLFADKHSPKKEDKFLVEEIKNTCLEIERAKCYFNEQTDSYEIEAVIFRLKELEMHYAFLIKQAKLEKICNTEGAAWQLKQ